MTDNELFHLADEVHRCLGDQAALTLDEVCTNLAGAARHQVAEALRFVVDIHMASMRPQARGPREYKLTDFGRLMLRPAQNRARRYLYRARLQHQRGG